MSARRIATLVVSGLLIAVATSACRVWTRDRDSDKVGRLLKSADRIYGERADPDRLDEAIQAYLDVLSIAPDDRRVLARLARGYYARGYGYPENPLADFALGREYGLRCLMTDSGFAGRVRTRDGRITDDAISAIDHDHGVCLTWTTITWSRWIVEAGPGAAALDLDILGEMGRRSVELVPTYDSGRAQEALGLALALPPTPLGPDRSSAALALDTALQRSPGRLSLAVDKAVLVSAPLGEVEAWRSALEAVAATDLVAGDPDLMENRRAVARAQESLSEGEPPEDPWSRLREKD